MNLGGYAWPDRPIQTRLMNARCESEDRRTEIEFPAQSLSAPRADRSTLISSHATTILSTLRHVQAKIGEMSSHSLMSDKRHVNKDKR